jgi:release factor glutamine methyltransferase
MATYQQAFFELKNKLQVLYDERESEAIAHEVLFSITCHNKTERLLKKNQSLTEKQEAQYEQATLELLQARPLQYVTGTAWFMGREFMVNESVLIPRPETEELVQWILDYWKSRDEQIKILDIGAGSGDIPISLKLALIQAEVVSCDISTDALKVARQNANKLQADIQLIELDFLDASQHNKLPVYDVIVSNPPYIPLSEKTRMHVNVTGHEPGIALFVPDDDPLLFYRAIARFGIAHLNDDGYIYCELDAAHAAACKALFEDNGYRNVEIRKDMHGNWRLLKAGMR